MFTAITDKQKQLNKLQQDVTVQLSIIEIDQTIIMFTEIKHLMGRQWIVPRQTDIRVRRPNIKANGPVTEYDNPIDCLQLSPWMTFLSN